MKIQCQLCREIVDIGPFGVADDGIEIACAACDGAFFVPRAGRPRATTHGPAHGSDRVGLVRIHCPKCARVQPPGTACRGCGLRIDRFAGFRGGDGDAPGDGPGEPDRIGALFAACEARWEDVDRHEAVIDAASAERAFSRVARLYRDAQARRPGDPIAAVQRARLARMAQAAFLTAAPPPDAATPEPYKNVLLMLIVLLVLGAGGLGVYGLVDPGAAQAQSRPMAIP